MMIVRNLMAAVAIVVFGASQASAIPIVFSDATPDNIGAGATRNITFSLDDSTEDLSTPSIQFDIGER